ncbi:hypothetical protein BD770DRAFT_446087 [Pilaira anomala]|nr:hypothetical protein BD770DRAFT_446087 [Pilaira anomala]
MTEDNNLDTSNRIKITIEEGLIIPVTVSSLEKDSTFGIFCYTQDPEMKIFLKMKKSMIAKAYNGFFNPTKIEGLSVTVHGYVLKELHECLSMFVNEITVAPTPIPIPESLQAELGLVKGLLIPQQRTETGRSFSTKDPKMKVSNILEGSVGLDEDVEFDAWKNNNEFDPCDDNDEDYPMEVLSDRLTGFSNNKVYGATTTATNTATEENGQFSMSSVLEIERDAEKVQYHAITVESTEAKDIFEPTEAEEVVTVFENVEIEEVTAIAKPTEDENVVKHTQDKTIMGKEPAKAENNDAMDTDDFDGEEENTTIVGLTDVITTIPPNKTCMKPVEISGETKSTDCLLPLKRKTMIVLNDESLNSQKSQDIQFGPNQQGGIQDDNKEGQVVLHAFSPNGADHPKRKKKSKIPEYPEDLRRSPRLALKERVKYFPPK